jgi:UDPglucose--hexose-1-phosphate uridylyltransferase
LNLTEDSHRRWNPLINEWVLVSPHRAKRPWLGAVEKTPQAEQPKYDPECYLCPGNSRAGGAQNPNYTSTFVFENDFAALKPKVSRERFDIQGKGLLVAHGEPGICRVMCFSPRHDLTIPAMSAGDVEEVVRVWCRQFRELGQMVQISYVQIFENRGEMMGASNPHPHCQIWATASIPDEPVKEFNTQRDYFQQNKSCLLCDYLVLEYDQRLRIVCQNEDFLAIVPFWAVWPYEVLVVSRQHLASFLDFTEKHVHSLSAMLQQITSAYNHIFEVPFPYSMGFHPSPTDGEAHPEWHFHAHYYPPLLRSATVRKFMVGFEMLGTPQRDFTPEMAAERLRSLVG